MLNYRISVTTLEKFRRFMAGTSSYDTEEALIDTLTGKFTGNDKTWIGSAFHEVIEKPGFHNHYHWQGTDYVMVKLNKWSAYIGMPVKAAQHALTYHNAHPRMFHEIPVGKMYQVPKHGIYISGRIDGIEAYQIRDAKCKFRSGDDVKGWQASCQWKFYIDILQGHSFYYDVFEITEYNGWPAMQKVRVDGDFWIDAFFLDGLDIRPHEAIPCISYAGIPDELHTLICDFMDWIDTRNHYKHLVPCDDKGHKTR